MNYNMYTRNLCLKEFSFFDVKPIRLVHINLFIDIHFGVYIVVFLDDVRVRADSKPV